MTELEYRIAPGELALDGKIIAKGYSGFDDGDGVPEPGAGKNDPTQEAVRGVGPIPEGRYRIEPPAHHPTAGPYAMRLTPLPGTQTFGRGGFLIHGDSREHPGAASHGCIVLSRAARELVWATGVRVLHVVSGLPESPTEVA